MQLCLENGSRKALEIALTFLSQQRPPREGPGSQSDASRGSVTYTDVVALRFSWAALPPVREAAVLRVSRECALSVSGIVGNS